MNSLAKKQPNRTVILAACVIIMLCLGIIYMWSIFSKYVCAFYGWELSQVSLTSSIMFAAFVVGIIFGGKLQPKIGAKITTIIGTLLFAGGIFLTSLIPAAYPWLLYITYGILAGFGVGMGYACALACSQAWFPDKRGFASGITLSTFGLSVVLFSPIAESLLNNYDPPTTFRIFALIFFVICFAAALLIKDKIIEETSIEGDLQTEAVKQYKPGEMIKSKYFYQITTILLCTAPAYLIIIPILRPLGELRGLPSNLAVFSVMLVGICGCVGRFIIGSLSDKIGRKYALITTSTITIISSLLLISITGIGFLVVTAAIGFAYGGLTALIPPTAGDYFGVKYVASNVGCIMLGAAFSSIFFPLFINSLSPGNVDYASYFIIPAITGAIALVCVLFMKNKQTV
jgi:OFA family oxalate/formate antiporter-like MFS transporter